MTTIVNSSTPVENRGGFGFLIGIVVLVAFVLGLLYFGILAYKNMGPLQVNVPAPQVNVETPKVVVPAGTDGGESPAQ